MNTPWHPLPQATGLVIDPAAPVVHFGDPAGELRAARDMTVRTPLLHLDVIDVIGEDARTFLHSQLTADINHLADGQVTHAAWCSAKGRMLASFLVWPVAGGYRLLLAADLREAIQKRLQMFVLRAKVKLSALTDSHALLGLAGPDAAACLAQAGLGLPDAAMGVLQDADRTVLRLADGRCIACVPAADALKVWDAAQAARPVGTAAWQWLDIQAAFPLVTAATREEFVPQMADFEKIGGVSFHKGCYPGQEIVARTQYLGKVKRHLFRVHAEAPMAAGNELFSPDNPDQSIGRIMTATASPAGGFAGLAVMQSNFAGNVRLAALDGPALSAEAVNP